MGKEISFENGRISDFQGLVTLTLTLDRVILHTFMHHSSTSTHIPISLKSKIWTDVNGRTYGRADGHFIPTVLGRLGGFDLKMLNSSSLSSWFNKQLSKRNLNNISNRKEKEKTQAVSMCRCIANE